MKKIFNKHCLASLDQTSDDLRGQHFNHAGTLPKVIFPSTRFYGSKRKQLDWLATELSAIRGATALDAFGGTGAVSHLLDWLGWDTTYNDIFEFNAISARAVFSSSTKYLKRAELFDLLESVKPFSGFITHVFSDLYFTVEENQWLDGVMKLVLALDGEKKDLLLYLIFQASLKKRPFNLFHRANLHLRESTMPVKFGNRTTWSKTFFAHIMSTYDELSVVQGNYTSRVRIHPPMCAKEIQGNFDLIYVDPPYFKLRKRNTDTYLQRYHFLEGLARFSEWSSLIDVESPQKIIKGPYRGELTNKYDLLGDLKMLFSKHRNSQFVLSYISGEAPSEEELYELFKDNFGKVKLSRRQYSRALSKKSNFELLLIGQ